MKFRKGVDRTAPISIDSLEALVPEDSVVRFIDLFVGSLDLSKMGFNMETKSTGSPPYSPAVLLKLFIYGYLNKERSSRKLERMTRINLELMWLLNKLSPDHNTISNFRRDNEVAIKNVFDVSVELAKKFDLIESKLVAGDGTLLRGQNSKKENFNEKKIDRQVKYLSDKVAKYIEELCSSEEEEKKKN